MIIKALVQHTIVLIEVKKLVPILGRLLNSSIRSNMSGNDISHFINSVKSFTY